MADNSVLAVEPRLLFTEQWDPPLVRRGDALGLRALADQFADAIAPGLSNRVRDGRWVTILAWCLSRSQEVFHARRGRSVHTRAEQQERYAWLRPLELMWVARTIALAEDWRDRSLAGQRRVRPWYEDGQLTDRFGMSSAQFRAYRQTGMYGGYRLAFRKWPGMTVSGDGWTPGKSASALASWMDTKLGAARPSWPIHSADDHEDSPLKAMPKLGQGQHHDWWLRHWKTFDEPGRSADENTLPRQKTDFGVLPEASLLKPLVFGDDQGGQRRLAVARLVEKASAADHMELCDHLGKALVHDRTIALLPRFSRLADAGMAAMDLVSSSLGKESAVTLSDVAGGSHAKEVCSELFESAAAWGTGAEMQLRHIETAHQFANAIPSARPIDVLRALLAHHELHGGGLRWFVLRNGKVEPRTPPSNNSSRYRFRLWSLCRLGAQCGVLRGMPRALREDVEAEDDQPFEDTDE